MNLNLKGAEAEVPLAAGVMSTANVQGNQILWAVKSGAYFDGRQHLRDVAGGSVKPTEALASCLNSRPIRFARVAEGPAV